MPPATDPTVDLHRGDCIDLRRTELEDRLASAQPVIALPLLDGASRVSGNPVAFVTLIKRLPVEPHRIRIDGGHRR
jgi:hypothetical protein